MFSIHELSLYPKGNLRFFPNRISLSGSHLNTSISFALHCPTLPLKGGVSFNHFWLRLNPSIFEPLSPVTPILGLSYPLSGWVSNPYGSGLLTPWTKDHVGFSEVLRVFSGSKDVATRCTASPDSCRHFRPPQ